MPMKRLILSLSAFALTFLVGCNKDVLGPDPVSRVEISISPDSEESVPATKGYTQGTSFKETYRSNLHNGTTDVEPRMMQISAYLYPQNGDEGNYFVGKTYAQSESDENIWWSVKPSEDGSSWIHDPVFWPVGGTLDFLAYSLTSEPGAAKGVSVAWDGKNSASKVTLNIPAENSQNDILYASAKGVKPAIAGSAVNLHFKHAQAWLEFELTGTEDLVKFNRIELENVYSGGSFEINNNDGEAIGRWTFSGAPTSRMPVDNLAEVKDLSDTPSYLDMLIPQQEKTSIVIYYTLGSETTVRGCRFETDRKTWLAGEKYIYSIHISSKDLTVTPSVVAWEDVNSHSWNLL